MAERSVPNDMLANITQTNAEHSAAVRELVDRRDLTRHYPRTTPGQGSDGSTQDETFRAERHRGECRPRIAGRRMRTPLEDDVVLEEDAVPAGRLRTLGQVHQKARIGARSPSRERQPRTHGPRS
jgi:hypothetical protein